MSIDHKDYSLEELLSAINVSLTTGSNMNRGNFAFQLLCDKLDVDVDTLAVNPHTSAPFPQRRYFDAGYA